MSVARKSQAYAIAILASLLILVLRSALSPTLGEVALLLPFVLAVILAAWRGGLGPGLLATALSAISGVFFFATPHLSAWGGAIAHGLNALFFVINGAAQQCGLGIPIHSAGTRFRPAVIRQIGSRTVRRPIRAGEHSQLGALNGAADPAGIEADERILSHSCTAIDQERGGGAIIGSR